MGWDTTRSVRDGTATTDDAAAVASIIQPSRRSRFVWIRWQWTAVLAPQLLLIAPFLGLGRREIIALGNGY